MTTFVPELNRIVSKEASASWYVIISQHLCDFVGTKLAFATDGFRRLGDVSKCKIQIVYWSVCIWVWTCKGGLGVSRDVNGHPWRSFFCHICRDFQLKDFQILSTKFTLQAQILNNFELLFDWFCEIMMFDYGSYLERPQTLTMMEKDESEKSNETAHTYFTNLYVHIFISQATKASVAGVV